MMFASRWVRVCFSAVVIAMCFNDVKAGITRWPEYASLVKEIGSRYPSVGQLVNATNGVATGTLIGSQWVLTAAHIVDNTPSVQFYLSGQLIKADAWYTPDTWLRQPFLGGNDIALVHLSQPLSDSTMSYATSGNPVGADATIVGFGMPGYALTGPTSYDGIRRGGTNHIDGTLFNNPNILTIDMDVAPNDPGYTGPTHDYQSSSDYPDTLEFLPTRGDGGAPAIVGGKIVGISSFMAGFFDGVSDFSLTDSAGLTNVANWAAWIQSVTAAVNNRQTPTGVRIGVSGQAIFTAGEAEALTAAAMENSASLTSGIAPAGGPNGFFLGPVVPSFLAPEPNTAAMTLVALTFLLVCRPRRRAKRCTSPREGSASCG